ncbi:hypothetical protein AK812_SmicGene21686 [Symbiodinium microadriaticum]|uniref:Uncharacterized protein n=1 Tax=Symbiodinium microadriaticum TaxID=2951 RepID=A0A1Q9DLS4_SYMMI|nr:hypothetical protein AK812_SmicGene21686 [Symbiodinium microadriaticum]
MAYDPAYAFQWVEIQDGTKYEDLTEECKYGVLENECKSAVRKCIKSIAFEEYDPNRSRAYAHDWQKARKSTHSVATTRARHLGDRRPEGEKCVSERTANGKTNTRGDDEDPMRLRL